MSITFSTPVIWPVGWPTTDYCDRTNGRSLFARNNQFHGQGRRYRQIGECIRLLIDELEKLGVERASITLNGDYIRDKGQCVFTPEDYDDPPDDVGVAVRLRRGGVDYDLATDAFCHTADNLRSLALAVDAMRRLERHGGGLLMARAMAGFAAITGPKRRAWWEILGVDQWASERDISSAFRKKAKSAHPDHGGTTAQMSELNAAREAGLREARA